MKLGNATQAAINAGYS
nr:hypothetical protein [Streptococcus sp. DD13]